MVQQHRVGIRTALHAGVISPLIALGAVLTGVSGAWAQDDAPKTKPFRIQLSAVFPTDGTAKDVLGTTLFGGGFSFDFPNKASVVGLPSPLVIALYTEGTGNSRTKNNLRVEGSYYAVGGALRFYPTAKQVIEAAKAGNKDEALQLAQKPQFYLGGGLGAYYLQYRVYNQILDSYIVNDRYSVNFGGKVFLGVDFGKLLFVEGNYTMPGNSHLNSWGLSLGFRL